MRRRYTDNLLAGLSLYKNTMKGKFIRDVQRQTNGPNLKTDGLEMMLEYAFGKIKSYFNYTYNHSLYDNREKVPEIANNTANLGFFISATQRIKLDVRGQYIGRRKNVKFITSTGSHYINDAFVIHSTLSILNIKGFDCQIICKNLLDAEYYHTSNNLPDRYRQPQRHIYIRIGYHY